MADGQGTFGGGGSVHWEVTVDDGNVPEIVNKKTNGNPPKVIDRGYTVKGVDEHQKRHQDPPNAPKPSRFFVVGIRPLDKKRVRVEEDPDGYTKISFEIDPRNTYQMQVLWALIETEVAEAVATLKAASVTV